MGSTPTALRKLEANLRSFHGFQRDMATDETCFGSTRKWWNHVKSFLFPFQHGASSLRFTNTHLTKECSRSNSTPKKLEHHQGEILLGKRLGVTLVASTITWALSHDARLSCQAKHLNLQSSLDGWNWVRDDVLGHKLNRTQPYTSKLQLTSGSFTCNVLSTRDFTRFLVKSDNRKGVPNATWFLQKCRQRCRQWSDLPKPRQWWRWWVKGMLLVPTCFKSSCPLPFGCSSLHRTSKVKNQL